MEQPKDFITISEFEEICAKEDPKKPKVDISLMVKRLPSLRAPGTWQVPLIKKGKDMKGRPITNYPNGYLYVAVESTRIKNHIEESVEDAYRRLSGKSLDIESIGVSKVEAISEGGKLSNTPKRKAAKAGEALKSGNVMQDSDGKVR